MKHTKQMNHANFCKHWRVYRMASIAPAVSAILYCPVVKSDENVLLYINSDNCTRANPSLSEQYTTAYNGAQQKVVKTAPKYVSRADCVAEFGEDQYTQVLTQAGMTAESQHSGGMWTPLMAVYVWGRMMGGCCYAQQSLFSLRATNSPSAHGQFVDTSSRSMTVPKTALIGEIITASIMIIPCWEHGWPSSRARVRYRWCQRQERASALTRLICVFAY